MDKHRLTVPARSSCAAGDDACERRFRSKVRGSLTLYGSFAASQSRILRRLPERKGPVLTYVQHPSCMYLILSDCRVGALRRGATSSPFSFFHRDILLGATPLTRSPSAIWFFFSHAVCGKARDKKGPVFTDPLRHVGYPLEEEMSERARRLLVELNFPHLKALKGLAAYPAGRGFGPRDRIIRG